jgi:hypothetical protein
MRERRVGSIAYLVNNTIPSETGIVYNDMNLAIAKLGRRLYQLRNMSIVQ